MKSIYEIKRRSTTRQVCDCLGPSTTILKKGVFQILNSSKKNKMQNKKVYFILFVLIVNLKE